MATYLVPLAQVLRIHPMRTWRTLGLRYEADPRPLHGYSDSDWAVQHSTSGWVFVLNQAAVSWGSKKQKSVALSSCEAEIVAASEASKEAVHLRGLAQELGYDVSAATDLQDNRSAIDVAYNPEHHTQMKHVSTVVISTCVSWSRAMCSAVLSSPRTITWPTSSPRLSLLRHSFRCAMRS